jgi:membrane-bound metal-dependent hydrolase YbcI (DUF457 family)
MASAAALGIGACFYNPGTPKSVWVVGALCAVVPDLDVIGFRLGIHYGDFWGHRGFTHSLLFAALLASAVLFKYDFAAVLLVSANFRCGRISSSQPRVTVYWTP